MIGKKVKILGYNPTVSRYRDDLVEIDGIILDKIIVRENVLKNTGTSDGYYSSSEIIGAVSVTKYLVLLEYGYGKSELSQIDPFKIKKVYDI